MFTSLYLSIIIFAQVNQPVTATPPEAIAPITNPVNPVSAEEQEDTEPVTNPTSQSTSQPTQNPTSQVSSQPADSNLISSNSGFIVTDGLVMTCFIDDFEPGLGSVLVNAFKSTKKPTLLILIPFDKPTTRISAQMQAKCKVCADLCRKLEIEYQILPVHVKRVYTVNSTISNSSNSQ